MIFSFRMGKESFIERNTSQVKLVLLLFFIFLKLTGERLIVCPTLLFWAPEQCTMYHLSVEQKTPSSVKHWGR